MQSVLLIHRPYGAPGPAQFLDFAAFSPNSQTTSPTGSPSANL